MNLYENIDNEVDTKYTREEIFNSRHEITGETLLQFASRLDKIKVCNDLLDIGGKNLVRYHNDLCNIDHHMFNGEGREESSIHPITWSLQNSNITLFETLFNLGANSVENEQTRYKNFDFDEIFILVDVIEQNYNNNYQLNNQIYALTKICYKYQINLKLHAGESILSLRDILHRDRNGDLLLDAILNHDIDMVKILIKFGIKKFKYRDDISPLLMAVQEGNTTNYYKMDSYDEQILAISMIWILFGIISSYLNKWIWFLILMIGFILPFIALQIDKVKHIIIQ